MPLTLRRMLALFAEGSLTPSAVADSVASRVDAILSRSPVLISWDLDRLRAGAAEATDRWRRDRARALEGVPVVVKDNFVVEGFRTTAGSRADVGIPPRQAVAVDRLVDAGAIVYAKANMTEYALRAHGRNPHFGDVPAPGAAGRLAGGSSSGSAAAVRLGLAPVALGSDTAGSVRVPAACCGVVGYKPAHGAIPLDGVVPLSPTCDHVGVITASVADVAPVLRVLGPRSADRAPLPVLALADALLDPLDPGLHAAYGRAARALGATMGVPRFVSEGGFDGAARIYDAVRGWEAGRAYGDAVKERPEDFGAETVAVITGFGGVSESMYRAALLARQRLRDGLVAELSGRALLLLPTTRAPAPPTQGDVIEIDGRRLPLHLGFIGFVLAFSLAGVPAMAVPAGPLPGGLTASVQLVCAPGDEAALLEAGLRLEAATPTPGAP